MGNSCNNDLLHARGGEDLAKIYFRASICLITVISSFLNSKVIQQYSTSVHD